MAETTRQRPGTMRLIDATQYRLPLAAWVSILHRVSGALMFVLLPFVIWMFDESVTSEISYGRFTTAFGAGIRANCENSSTSPFSDSTSPIIVLVHSLTSASCGAPDSPSLRCSRSADS